MKIASWNVNGLRAVLRRGDLQAYLAADDPDILCLQETRAEPHDVDEAWAGSYAAHWNPALRKGYAGTVILTKPAPLGIRHGLGAEEFDAEGRVLTAEYADFFLVNAYVPNSQRELTRLPFRQRWDEVFLRFLKKLERRKPVVFCGDFNVAHREIDLAHPKANEGTHGFTVEERAGFEAFLGKGFLDTFREFEPGGGHYTWWSPMRGVRARNVGWRIDYVLISKALRPRLKAAFIRPDVPGSDHCPVGILID